VGLGRGPRAECPWWGGCCAGTEVRELASALGKSESIAGRLGGRGPEGQRGGKRSCDRNLCSMAYRLHLTKLCIV